MHALVTWKNEENPVKNEVTRVATIFSHCKSMGTFRDAQGQLTPKYVIRSDRTSKSVEAL